jgi:hypothetical protein
MHPRASLWYGVLAGALLTAGGCAPATEEQRRPAPTGRYEGTLRYRGAELPVVVNLYQDSASQAVQLQLRAPGAPLYSRWFDSVAYQAPTLSARLPGGSRLTLREEPNFLTGAVWLHDTLRAELVAVRRGTPDLPAYAVARRTAAGQPWQQHYVPLDTVQRRPAVLLWPDPGALGAAYGWADWLASQGLVVTLAVPGGAPDSLTAQQLRTALQSLRDYGAAGVDSGRVGVWATGNGGRVAALAAGASPGLPAAFMVVQGAAFGPADRAGLRQLGRQGLPVLGLYGGRDTTVNVPISSQQLRLALGRRQGSGVKVYEQADRGLLLASKADSVGRWPQLPADLASSLGQWLGGLPRRR